MFEEELVSSSWRDKWPPPCETLHSDDDTKVRNSKRTEVGEPKGQKRKWIVKGWIGFKLCTDGDRKKEGDSETKETKQRVKQEAEDRELS